MYTQTHIDHLTKYRKMWNMHQWIIQVNSQLLTYLTVYIAKKRIYEGQWDRVHTSCYQRKGPHVHICKPLQTSFHALSFDGNVRERKVVAIVVVRTLKSWKKWGSRNLPSHSLHALRRKTNWPRPKNQLQYAIVHYPAHEPKDMSTASEAYCIKTFFMDRLAMFGHKCSAQNTHQLCERLYVGLLSPDQGQNGRVLRNMNIQVFDGHQETNVALSAK